MAENGRLCAKTYVWYYPTIQAQSDKGTEAQSRKTNKPLCAFVPVFLCPFMYLGATGDPARWKSLGQAGPEVRASLSECRGHKGSDDP